LLFEDILVDYSKNLINQETIALLNDLAEECQLKEAIEAMFQGLKINQTEGRAGDYRSGQQCNCGMEAIRGQRPETPASRPKRFRIGRCRPAVREPG
jgi:glucose-6-phosphate isomerase